MKRLNLLIAIFSLGVFMTACNKESKDDVDPIVIINSPGEMSTIGISDTLELRANVTDDTKLATILISSTLGINQSITSFDSDTSHFVGFNLTLDPATPLGVYNLTLSATDDEGNTGSDEVEITVE